MKPVLKYRGGKKSEIKHFESHLPLDFDTYIEPFFGGGALFFHLEHKKSVINDINHKLINFYKDLKHNYAEMKSQLNILEKIYRENQDHYEMKKKESPKSTDIENKNEELYYNLRREFNYPTGEWLESVLYYFINKTAYSGMIRYNKSGEFNVPFGRYKNFNTNIITDEHYELMKSTKIFNFDFENILDMAKPNDFIFLDPPYDCTFSDYGNIVFSGDFDENEHRRLAQAFKKTKGKALMIVSSTELTKELYDDYIFDEYDKSYSVNIRNRFKSEAKHLVIRNYKDAVSFSKEICQFKMV